MGETIKSITDATKADLDNAGTFDDFEVTSSNGKVYRLIHEDKIQAIYDEEVQEILQKDYCDDLPGYIVVDWDLTIENVKEYDGYATHFATYDGEEQYAEDYYIFRTE